jgi:aspartyl-tRNA(Asn)/glutamyl-tRNA(Gln) amidotransferase subunit A
VATSTVELPLSDRTITEVAELLRHREVSSRELTEACLARIDRDAERLNTFLAVGREQALAAADAADASRRAGEGVNEPLLGIPYALKDIFVTRALDEAGQPNGGLPTTAGSRILEGYRSPYAGDAEERLTAAGAILLGKTNCDEFAMGSSNENSAFGPVRNPVAPDRVPGGSSGGSAACVAQGTAVVSLGTDTGGSVRQPASFCGVVGVTPTYGRVSRYGLTAFASSLDHIGPFARSVRDAATLLQVMAGHDPHESTSAHAPVPDYSTLLDGNVKGLKLGLPREYLKDLTSETGDLIRGAVEELKRLGCEVRDISLPATEYAIATYYVIATAEASSNLARYDGVRYTTRSENSGTLADMYRNTRGEGFGAECKRRIMLGTYVLSHGYYDAYYLKAQKVRALIARDFARAFEEVDAIVAPVSPFPAFRLGEKVDDPIAMYLSDIYTITGSLAGIPCMSVPCGKTADGLPVGMQILTKHFDEGTMFRLADAYERR